MKKIFLILGLAILFIAPAISQNASDSNFELITENRQLAAFDGINVTGRFKVVIYESAVQEVSVTSPDKLLNAVETQVENGVLKINMQDAVKDKDNNVLENLKTKYNDYLLRQPIEIKVGLPNLKSISARGASRIESQGVLSSTNLTVELSGASKADLNCNISNELTVSLAEAVKLDIQGSAASVAVKANGASAHNGGKLIAKNASVDLNGASRAEVYASENFEANLNGATKAICTGSPKKVKQNASRGSSITIK